MKICFYSLCKNDAFRRMMVRSASFLRLQVLTEVGIEQATALREKISDMKFDAVFCSPFERAKQTARIITDDRNDIILILSRSEKIRPAYFCLFCGSIPSYVDFLITRGNIDLVRRFHLEAIESIFCFGYCMLISHFRFLLFLFFAFVFIVCSAPRAL